MASVNKVILIGNLGADPDVKELESGTKVANLSIATSENFKDRQTGERKTNTDWHKITAFNQLAGLVEQYLSKGRQIYVEGKLKQRSFEDKEGNPRKVTEVWADTITFLGSGGGSDGESKEKSTSEKPETASPQAKSEKVGQEGDDLPF